MRCNNVIFPIWMIILFPPIIFLIIPGNFIIDSLVLLITLRILKLKGVYSKTIFKVFVTGFIADIIGAMFLFIGLMFPIFEAIAFNPFDNIFSFIYMLVSIIISGVFIYFINKIWSFKNLDKKNKHILSLVLAVVTAPYLFMLPTELVYNGLTRSYDDYKGISIESKHIDEVVEFVTYTDRDIKVNDKKLSINNIESSYFELEEYASKLFNLIVDLEEVKINNYTFTKEYINSIYSDIYNKDYYSITDRYNKEIFYEYDYFGHVNGYDLFNYASFCTNESQELYKDNEYTYNVKCSSVDDLYLVKDKKLKLKDSIGTILEIDDLKNTRLEIEVISNENNSK